MFWLCMIFFLLEYTTTDLLSQNIFSGLSTPFIMHSPVITYSLVRCLVTSYELCYHSGWCNEWLLSRPPWHNTASQQINVARSGVYYLGILQNQHQHTQWSPTNSIFYIWACNLLFSSNISKLCWQQPKDSLLDCLHIYQACQW